MIAYHMHVMLDDAVYVYELEKWIDKLGQYMESMKQAIEKKQELSGIYNKIGRRA